MVEVGVKTGQSVDTIPPKRVWEGSEGAVRMHEVSTNRGIRSYPRTWKDRLYSYLGTWTSEIFKFFFKWKCSLILYFQDIEAWICCFMTFFSRISSHLGRTVDLYVSWITRWNKIIVCMEYNIRMFCISCMFFVNCWLCPLIMPQLCPRGFSRSRSKVGSWYHFTFLALRRNRRPRADSRSNIIGIFLCTKPWALAAGDADGIRLLRNRRYKGWCEHLSVSKEVFQNLLRSLFWF